MSRHPSTERSVTIVDPEVLAVIREEQNSCTNLSVNINSLSKDHKENKDNQEHKEPKVHMICEPCAGLPPLEREAPDRDAISKALKEQEETLRNEFREELENEISRLKDKFDFILENEEVRASLMLREAHRERQEKINALQRQLECKNLAGLMYVLSIERRQSKLDRLRIIEEYTNYILALQDILSDGQQLILYLSRGYKSAARVDFEWKEKMNKVIKQFQNFICDFSGCTPEGVQHFFDLPKLCKVNESLVPNLDEDPCECYEEEEVHPGPEPIKTWWEQLEDECKPFVVFGDMADFKAPQRREVLKIVKAAKTAPRKWKNYVFNDMFVSAACSNTATIKHIYPMQHGTGREDIQTQTLWDQARDSTQSSGTRRLTTNSADIRGNMGSILKIITGSSMFPRTERSGTKATILGARDSLEIASSTKLLKEKAKDSAHSGGTSDNKLTFNIGHRRTSLYEELDDDDKKYAKEEASKHILNYEDENEIVVDTSKSCLGSIHNDSIPLMADHVPDRDATIHYEKVCPMEQCQHLQVDSFIRSLPQYMRASPFLHFEQTFDEYEPCTPEQIKMLIQKIEEKKKKAATALEKIEDPLAEWRTKVDGVAVQTSDTSLTMAPCTCRNPNVSIESSQIQIFKLEDLVPLKKALDDVRKECFFDDEIEFNRFKVIGDDKKQNAKEERGDFKSRLDGVKKILNKYPSLCSLFQANTSC